MRLIYPILCLLVLLTGCKNETETSPEAEADNSVADVFESNSKTVLANLDGWENENMDYSMYAEDFIFAETGFGAEKDSLSLNDMMANDKMVWEKYDFKLITNPPDLLPGVNADTKLVDGSVRYYGIWEVTLPATDSTEARSGQIKLYESYDFNEEGKIMYQQVYGDFTGLMIYLNSGM